MKNGLIESLALAAIVIGAPVWAQEMPDIGFKSVGRGAPVVNVQGTPEVGPNWIRQQGQQAGPDPKNAFPLNGFPVDKLPKSYKPLERDIFTSDDFYKDKDLWMVPRYYRCNSPQATEYQRGILARPALNIGPFSESQWGHCELGVPREAIISPYGFKTAKEHYEALLAETKKRGGPTKQTYEAIADWTGRYAHPGQTPNRACSRGREEQHWPSPLGLPARSARAVRLP